MPTPQRDSPHLMSGQWENTLPLLPQFRISLKAILPPELLIGSPESSVIATLFLPNLASLLPDRCQFLGHASVNFLHTDLLSKFDSRESKKLSPSRKSGLFSLSFQVKLYHRKLCICYQKTLAYAESLSM